MSEGGMGFTRGRCQMRANFRVGPDFRMSMSRKLVALSGRCIQVAHRAVQSRELNSRLRRLFRVAVLCACFCVCVCASAYLYACVHVYVVYSSMSVRV